MRIVADITIIAEEEVSVGRDYLCTHRITERTLHIGFVQENTINIDDAMVDTNGIARETDNAFNPLFTAIIRGFKDNDIAPLRVAEPVGGFEHNNSLSLIKIGFHTGLEYFIGLQSRPGGEKYNQSQNDSDDYFTKNGFSKKVFQLKFNYTPFSATSQYNT